MTDDIVAFVLGGGGMLGASEVGMLGALLDAGVEPDLVLGTSVGAINGAAIAADPSLATVERLRTMWGQLGANDIFEGSLLQRVGNLAKTRISLHENAGLRRRLEETSGGQRIEDLPVRFECVAASIERAASHWFTRGPVVDAVLASCSVPGLLPPVVIDGEHFIDGGLVDSIPIGRAIALGATIIYVLQVGRIESPLRAPRWLWEVATISFEIARRSRFADSLAAIPEGVTVHVLPSGQEILPGAAVRYRDTAKIGARIDRAWEQSSAYLLDPPT